MKVAYTVKDIKSLIPCKILGTQFSEPITDYHVDSRKCTSGCAFVPLVGEKTDGHLYIEEALRNGASLSFVAEKFWEKNKKSLLRHLVQHSAIFVVVSDPLWALQKLAKEYRTVVSPFVIGITGSSGKTTTKEMIAALLKKGQKQVYSNEGNFNSEIGLPLSVLRMPPDTKIAIFEMAIDFEGEMRILADIARPQMVVVTNIGTAHIEKFHSIENIAQEKRQIFSHFDTGCKAFIARDESCRAILVEGITGTVFDAEAVGSAMVDEITDLGIDGYRLRIGTRECKIAFLGYHNIKNLYKALTVANEFDLTLDEIIEALKAMRPLFGRGQIVKGEYTTILDCYNANPESVKAALDYFALLNTKGGRKVAILGSMLELGCATERAHKAIGKYLCDLPIEKVFFVGTAMQVAHDAYLSCEHKGSAVFFETVSDLVKLGTRQLRQGDFLLLKASRGVKLEMFAEKLRGA
jgi:UDP-N-acetylmuramoyl-tripeptide--D-alanyl-D-alanine ligase